MSEEKGVQDVWEVNDAEKWFKDVATKSGKKFTLLVFYRGDWCPFCYHYLMELKNVHKELVANGGQVIACCAQVPSVVVQTKLKWELPFAHVIGDPEQKLANYVRNANLLKVVITGKGGDEGYTTGAYEKAASMHNYTHGMVQPGVLVVNEKMQTLFKWFIEPRLMNLGGAADRPDIKAIVKFVEAKVKGEISMDVGDTVSALNNLKTYGVFTWGVFKNFFKVARLISKPAGKK